jgi:hypothetical protein
VRLYRQQKQYDQVHDLLKKQPEKIQTIVQSKIPKPLKQFQTAKRTYQLLTMGWIFQLIGLLMIVGVYVCFF